jgi:hypothetical protein
LRRGNPFDTFPCAPDHHKEHAAMTRLLIGLLGVAVLAPALSAADKEPPYVHAVIFYLKKDAPKDTVEKAIADSHELLAKVPTVRKLWVGRPAAKSTPKFAKTDYNFGLLVLFDNADGLIKYIDDPLHVKFVDRYGKFFEIVHVYDFENQQK